MEWITDLQGKIVGVDTVPFIYLIEEHPIYIHLLRPFFESLDRGNFIAVTSTVTLLEVLVHPIRSGNDHLAHEYRDILLNSANLRTVEISSSIAEAAARLRALHHIRTPDALQIATANEMGAMFFLTNDRRLAVVPSPRVLLLKELL